MIEPAHPRYLRTLMHRRFPLVRIIHGSLPSLFSHATASLPFHLLRASRPRRSIRAGEPPDGSTYQDGYGKTRKWTKEEMEGKGSWSYFDPRTWFGYKPLSEVNVTPTAANAA